MKRSIIVYSAGKEAFTCKLFNNAAKISYVIA